MIRREINERDDKDEEWSEGKNDIKMGVQRHTGTFSRMKLQHYIFYLCPKHSQVDERTRKKLYELRTTWNEVFAKSKLYGLDVKVQAIDPAWPLPVVQPSSIGGAQPTASKHTIHINPNIIKVQMSWVELGRKDYLYIFLFLI